MLSRRTWTRRKCTRRTCTRRTCARQNVTEPLHFTFHFIFFFSYTSHKLLLAVILKNLTLLLLNTNFVFGTKLTTQKFRIMWSSISGLTCSLNNQNLRQIGQGVMSYDWTNKQRLLLNVYRICKVDFLRRSRLP